METAEIRDLRQHYALPPSITLRAEGTSLLAFRPEFEAALGSLAAAPEGLPLSPLGGRAPLRVLLAGDERLLARPYRKGGLLRHVRGKRFCGDLRPLRELALHVRLQDLGVPVVDAVGALIERHALGWRGFLVSREVPDSLDLEGHLYGRGGAAAPPRRLLLKRAGMAVRQLHDAGVSHADLHAKNLLVDGEGRIFLLDLDRAETVDGPLDDERRLKNLVRLGRSLEKHRRKGMSVSPQDELAFLEGYAGDKPKAEAWFARIQDRLAKGLSLRVLWWRLIGQTRPGTGPGRGEEGRS